jgi:hypothetical protein
LADAGGGFVGSFNIKAQEVHGTAPK